MNTENKHTPAKYAAVWYGPSGGRSANQYAVQDTDTMQAVAWCDTLEQAKDCAARLNSHASLVAEKKRLREALWAVCSAFATTNRDCEEWKQYRDALAALNPEGTT